MANGVEQMDRLLPLSLARSALCFSSTPGMKKQPLPVPNPNLAKLFGLSRAVSGRHKMTVSSDPKTNTDKQAVLT